VNNGTGKRAAVRKTHVSRSFAPEKIAVFVSNRVARDVRVPLFRRPRDKSLSSKTLRAHVDNVSRGVVGVGATRTAAKRRRAGVCRLKTMYFGRVKKKKDYDV